MTAQIFFDGNGKGSAVVIKDELEDGGYVLPEGASTFAARYKLVDGEVVDEYEGFTDDDVVEAIQEAEVADAIARANANGKAKLITKLQFLSLFTDTEIGAIYDAAKVNPTLEAWIDKMKMAEYPNPIDPGNKTYMNLNDERTQAGIAGLVLGGFVTAERAARIKANLPPV